MEKQLPQPGWRYRHFKGGLYQIVTLALNTETGEDMVVYQALYDDFKVYVRPLSMFLSETDFVKYPDSTQPMRFERIDAEDDRNVPKPLETTSCEPSFEETTEELPDGISPKLIAFLDADSDEERYTILNEMEDIVDDHMIDTMAVVSDLVIEDGPISQRFQELKRCIRTRINMNQKDSHVTFPDMGIFFLFFAICLRLKELFWY